jgi:hypothetical protein
MIGSSCGSSALVSTHCVHGAPSGGDGLGNLCDDHVGGEESPGNGGSVFKGASHNLGGVDNSRFDEVFVLVCGSVVANVVVLLVQHLCIENGIKLIRCVLNHFVLELFTCPRPVV